MSKRTADRQITQDILDREEEPEEAGQFERASQSELEGRVFKKARRTQPATSADQSGADRGLFAGISLTQSLTQQNGVSSSSLAPPQPPLFSFSAGSSSSNPLSGLGFGKAPLQRSSIATSSSSSIAASSSSSIATSSAPRPTFLSELRSLNTSVNDWIGKHVRENPYVDLTPIFRDYEKHLRELDSRFQGQGSASREEGDRGSEVVACGDASKTDTPPSTDMSQAGHTERDVAMENEREGGQGAEESQEPQTQEGEDSCSKPRQTPAADEEEKEALFSVRAKLFYKKASGSEFTELGIGQMRVLPGNGEGVKAVMRNDTSLSKVLLNVRVTETVPLSSKNNNVFLVCVPNPPLERKDESEPVAVTYLIRVKTVTMATGLLQALRETTSTDI